MELQKQQEDHLPSLKGVGEVRKENPMNGKCAYFIEETKVIKSATITGTRMPARPDIVTIRKCTHAESMYAPGTITADVPCNGDRDQCVIPENIR